MRQPEIQADWLLEQSQQHFQKLASLAVRTEGAQRMGKLAAHRDAQPLVAGFSKVGCINPSLTKVALNPISMIKTLVGGAKAAVRGGARAGKIAVPKPPSVIMKGQLGAVKGTPKPPVAAPTPPTAGRSVQPAASTGAAPGRAVAPTAPAPAPGIPPAGQAGGAGQLAGAPAPLARPVSAPPPSRGPAPSHLAKQTGDSQNIVSAKRMAEVTGRSPVDEYARMLEQAGYGTGMGGSTGASAARSLATGAATPGAKASRSVVSRGPSRVSAPAPSAAPASPVGTALAPAPLRTAGTAVAPSPIRVGQAAQPLPIPPTQFQGGAQGVGQLVPQGPPRVGTAVRSSPVANVPQGPARVGTVVRENPVANVPQGTGRVRGKQSLDDRIAHSQRAGEMRDAINAEDMAALGVTPGMATGAGRASGAGELVGEAAQQATGQAAGQVGGIRGVLGRLPRPLKYAPHAIIGGGGLAVGGLALGGGMAMQQSNAPYRYGGGSPMPGMFAQQM